MWASLWNSRTSETCLSSNTREKRTVFFSLTIPESSWREVSCWSSQLTRKQKASPLRVKQASSLLSSKSITAVAINVSQTYPPSSAGLTSIHELSRGLQRLLCRSRVFWGFFVACEVRPLSSDSENELDKPVNSCPVSFYRRRHSDLW